MVATGRIGVAATAGVSARSRNAARNGGSMRSHAAGDFAADIHRRGIERVDDQRRARRPDSVPVAWTAARAFSVAAARAREQIVDGEMLGGGRAVAHSARAEVPRRAWRGSRRTPPSTRSIRTSTSGRPSTAAGGRTRRPGCAGRAALRAETTTPTPRPSDADTNTKSPVGLSAAVHRPQLRDRADAAGVFDLDRHASGPGEHVAQVDVAPTQRGRVQHAHRRALDHARHRDANAVAVIDLAVVRQHPLDAAGQRLHQRFRIALGGQRDDAADRLADEISQHQRRLADADVDGHHGAAPRIDIEERGLSAAHRVAGGAFDDRCRL